VDLRQLEAFVAVADELHFKRAAEKLHVGQPTLSDLVRRLERELGTQLFTRSTRRVVITEAGVALLARAKSILEDVAEASAAVRQFAGGATGTVRLAITPPAAPILAPHLEETFKREAPGIDLVVRRMWLPDLLRAIPEGRADVAVTPGLLADQPGIISDVFCAEPIVVGLRPEHPLAGDPSIRLCDLEGATLGIQNGDLFPGWATALQTIVEAQGMTPPTVELRDIDLAARDWRDQQEVDWTLTTRGVSAAEAAEPLLPLSPPQYLPYTLRWCPIRAATGAVGRFVQLVLTADAPKGWIIEADHLRYGQVKGRGRRSPVA
jgi:DNA-binding transcriptional LysR family regulator